MVVVIVSLCLHGVQAIGQTKATSRFPLITPTLPPGETGYSIFIEADCCGSERGGYQACRFTIETNPCAPVGVDQRFLITVEDNYYQGGTATTATVEIKAGQSAGTAELLLSNVRQNSWVSYTIKSEQDGVICRSNFSYQTGTSNSYEHGNLMPNTLMVNSGILEPRVDAQAVSERNETLGIIRRVRFKRNAERSGCRRFTLLNKHSSTRNSIRPRTTMRFLLPTVGTMFSPVDRLIYQPIGQPFQVSITVFISMADLKAVSQTRSAKRDALRRWVVAGGTLVVLDPKSKFKKRDSVFPLLIGVERATLLDTPFDQWKAPAEWLESLDETLVDPSLIEDRWNRQNYLSVGGAFVDISDYDDQPTGRSISNDNFRSGVDSPFVMQRFANGLVVLASSNTSNWDEQDWRYFYNAVQIEHFPLSEHIGSGNASFFEPGFWIPGIGNPPVLAFQILIALFMIVAGPVMLLVLKRTRRMQLLFTLIPLLSILTCSSLFAYAMLTDGLVTLGRARTFTRIDSRTGDAVTHTRASYYNGRQPPSYKYDQSTVVVQNTGSRGGLKIRRDQRGSEFLYSGGRIRARSPHQIVSMRTHEIRSGLRKIYVDNAGNKLSAKEIRFQNRLGADAELIVFRTSGGYFYAKDVNANTTQSANAIDLSAAASLIKQILAADSPKVDNYMQREERQNKRYGKLPPRYLGDEHRISQLLQSGKIDSAMPINSWLAITKSFEPAEKELGDAKMKNMLHFIAGDWQP